MNQDRNHDLSAAVGALSAGDPDAIPKLYDLTSGALYGKLVGLLAKRDLASAALKATYRTLWQKRRELEIVEGREFQLIAAVAHQCALEIRFNHERKGGALSMVPPKSDMNKMVPNAAAPRVMNKQDEALLKAAYLKFEQPETLAERFGMSTAEVRTRLASLASGKGGHHNE